MYQPHSDASSVLVPPTVWFQGGCLINPLLPMQICFAGGSQLLSLHRGQNGKWTDIAFDLVVTYCSVHIEVQKGRELILQNEELPTAFKKSSHERLGYPLDRIISRCCQTPPG